MVTSVYGYVHEYGYGTEITERWGYNLRHVRCIHVYKYKPLGFKKLALSTHHAFDQIALDGKDLGDIEQIVEPSQTKAIGYAIHYATKYMDGKRTLRKIIDLTINDIASKGLDILPPYLIGDLSYFRSIELASAINRMRTLKMNQKK